MKLVINYDFFNAIRNVKDPLPLKLVRNDSKYIYGPVILVACDYMIGNDPITFPLRLLSLYSIYAAADLITTRIYKKEFNLDKYALDAQEKLRLLPDLLNTINVETNYNML